jgi:hypothetical protein
LEYPWDSHITTGASQSALSIQNPSQTGPRTQGDDDFETHGAASAISTTAPVEESAAMAQLGYARHVFGSARTLFVSNTVTF